MLRLLKIIKNDRHLQCLSLGFNRLIHDQPTKLASAASNEIQNGSKEEGISPENKKILKCLSNFIKYNLNLSHLDLQATGLNDSAIRFIVQQVSQSHSLQNVHLCGNEGISQALVEWIAQELDTEIEQEEMIITIPNYQGPMQQQSISQIRNGTQQFKENKSEWNQVQEGLKLREIINSMRMNELS